MTGRYAGLDVATCEVDDGAGGRREVRFLRRRVLPDPRMMPTAAVHQVAADDRIDLIAAMYLGDPAAFWRVCDANAALDPFGLVGREAEGTTIVIPVPGL